MGVDLTVFAIVATYILFAADIDKWWRERNLKLLDFSPGVWLAGK